jgi:uncharacterized protein YgbK (DUF1537 family)
MPIHLAILADDLTGALDAGAPFARRGFGVEVWMEGVGERAPARVGVDVLAVNLGTRHVAPRTAGPWAARAAAALRAAGVNRFFKKMDSTLRGPWAEELAAVRGVHPTGPVVVCPAFPAQGRTVRDGRVMLLGEACGELPAALRAVGGRAASLPALGGLGRGAARAALRAACEPSPQYIVADASEDADLAALIAAARAERLDGLLCGAAGLAAAWAASLRPRARPAPIALPRLPRVLVVSGSQQAIARAQVAAVERAIRAQVLPPGTLSVLTPAATGPAERADPRVAAALGDAAARQYGERPFEGLVLTGGETATRVLRALGARRLRLEDEWEAGVPLSRPLEGAAAGRLCVTKAGGFGDHQCLARLLEQLTVSPDGPSS